MPQISNARPPDIAELMIKSNILNIGCYVWLLPTRLLANTDCLLKLYMLVKSARTVSREFCMEKRVYIGRTSYV